MQDFPLFLVNSCYVVYKIMGVIQNSVNSHILDQQGSSITTATGLIVRVIKLRTIKNMRHPFLVDFRFLVPSLVKINVWLTPPILFHSLY